ncbi:hypothetical protein [Rhizobium sophorae]|uniref:hypothetical protein n=1 Tax=Rhizobium sophorae TaxID=1535242 RepID=UPI001FEA6362|nr:hypothetical protein [Rhizobium sophorae]
MVCQHQTLLPLSFCARSKPIFFEVLLERPVCLCVGEDRQIDDDIDIAGSCMRRDVRRPLGDDVARCQPTDQKDGITPGAEAAEERNQDALAVASNIGTVAMELRLRLDAPEAGMTYGRQFNVTARNKFGLAMSTEVLTRTAIPPKGQHNAHSIPAALSIAICGFSSAAFAHAYLSSSETA